MHPCNQQQQRDITTTVRNRPSPSACLGKALALLALVAPIIEVVRRLRDPLARVFARAKARASKLGDRPLFVLVMFPFVATPANFARSQRDGLIATVVATSALPWLAVDVWSSAVQECAGFAMRIFDQQATNHMDEATKQQFEWVLSLVLGRPMAWVIFAVVVAAALVKTGWYLSFLSLFRKGTEPTVGFHFFLIQTASKALYAGAVMYAGCFLFNNWLWAEDYARSVAASPLVLLPGVMLCEGSRRYRIQKERTDLLLYGSSGAARASSVMALAPLILLAGAFIAMGP